MTINKKKPPDTKKTTKNKKSAPVARPLSKQHMPKDYSISLAEYVKGGPERLISDPDKRGPKQSMRGFESTYQNIIDYIVRITHRIWEEDNIDYIYDTYHENSQVYDDYGLQSGAKKIVADTNHTVSAFPKIQLVADEIVWAGNDEVGFHTSHRTIIRGKNTGPSKYGPATNREIDVWCIANCVALDNEIFLEHVLYNNSSMLKQLGFDLNESARKLAAASPAGWSQNSAARKTSGQCGTIKPEHPTISDSGEGFDIDDFVRSHYHKVWNHREVETLGTTHASNLTFHGPTDRAFNGLDQYQTFLVSFFAMFPDIEHSVDEVYWMGNDKEGYLSSVRWSGIATHSGNGSYGSPTNREVYIWGITQHKIVDGRIIDEWMLFNEMDLMMQLAGPLEQT